MILETEYHPYYKSYIYDLALSGKTIVEVLQENQDLVNHILTDLPREKEGFRYAKDKWTIKELMQHCIDTERIFNYRALRFARNDQTSLQGFEQDDFNEFSLANNRDLKAILEEFNSVRKSTISLYRSFTDQMLLRKGMASGNLMSVRALGYLTAGHVKHHINVFKERYL